MQEQLILDAQQAWGQGIVKIGKVFLDKGDYRAAAESHINEFYNYQEGSVLFKPIGLRRCTLIFRRRQQRLS